MKVEYFGKLVKKEYLVELADKQLGDVQMLESPAAFPGYFTYYGEVPVERGAPRYTYLLMNESYELETILRAEMRIKAFTGLKFESTPATIKMGKKSFHAIRVRGIDNYQVLPNIIRAYTDFGISFKLKSKNTLKGEALIEVVKFFNIEPSKDGRLFGALRKDYGYVMLPTSMDWDTFEKLTKEVKYNWEESHFDVALAYVFTFGNVLDMIRVYHPEMSDEYLKRVQDAYMGKIKETSKV